MMKSFSDRAHEETKRVRAFKKELKQYVALLPDTQEGVQLLSKNCAMVSSRMLLQKGTTRIMCIWSPSYFLNRNIKKQLITIIDKTKDIEVLDKKIQDIIETQQIRVYSPKHGFYVTGDCETVPEGFCRALMHLWYGEETADEQAKAKA